MNPSPGAIHLGDGRVRFRVWSPFADRVAAQIESPRSETVPLEPGAAGYFQAVTTAAPPGTRYRYRLDDGEPLPDPASRYQPDGVHGVSCVVDGAFPWTDENWVCPRLEDFIIYELHVGTFTPEGTFDGAAQRLDELVDLGVTAIELMPVAQFPGERNWGYDGVFPYAVQASYGGPDGLRRLVNACHDRGLAVVLDVVYNHLGPEGNYLGRFGPYFTDTYRTPWGDALNFDGPGSDQVRAFFIHNALHWAETYHIDALRLDAVHAIMDRSAYPFLRELADHAGERMLLIAESDANDPRHLSTSPIGGLGMDGQWVDDFHHALHAVLTGESDGYYADYGDLDHVVRALRDGFVYTGQYSSYRDRRHGRLPEDIERDRFVVFAQNHDQVGNRMSGERLAELVSRESLKLAAGAVVLCPPVPLLFMGEEYGETAPFQYFTSHSEPDLVEAVRRGRSAEFASFRWRGEPPDPQDRSTFVRSRLQRNRDRHLLDYYRRIIALRKRLAPTRRATGNNFCIERTGDVVSLTWGPRAAVVMNFGDGVAAWRPPQGKWKTWLDSADGRWGGPGATTPARVDGHSTVTIAPRAVTVFVSEELTA